MFQAAFHVDIGDASSVNPKPTECSDGRRDDSVISNPLTMSTNSVLSLGSG
jgi:hypothetical protein